MKLTVIDDQQTDKVQAEVLFHLIGPNKIQNDLLASFIGDKLGAATDASRQINPEFRETNHCHFFIIDCLNSDKIDPWTLYKMERLQSLEQHFIFLYNVNPEADIEKSAVSNGAHGICYYNESYRELPKAINAVLEGELWYSRKTLSKYVQIGNYEENTNDENAGGLTSREKEILIRIAGGASNQEIADDLCVSLYTVKSHIYKTYKKINVKNRLQASLWAAKYL